MHGGLLWIMRDLRMGDNRQSLQSLQRMTQYMTHCLGTNMLESERENTRLMIPMSSEGYHT